MTDNRTTELREMLDARGVKYQTVGKTLTYWNCDGSDNKYEDADFVAYERPDGTLAVEGLTPEQAIAATLGSGTCRDKNGFDESLGFECTVCETTVNSYMQTTTNDKPEQFRFCPNCGREVKQWAS